MYRFRRSAVVAGFAAALAVFTAQAATPISDAPLYSASNVPANLMLALSVEYPTGVTAAYTDNAGKLQYTDNAGVVQSLSCGGQDASAYGVCYFTEMKYLGYFDNGKCYDYDTVNNYFYPVSVAGTCNNQFSGNLLNWASMTVLDEFRQTLTGGNRSTDTAALTVLQRSRQVQSANYLFPVKRLSTSPISTGGITVSGSGSTQKIANVMPTSGTKLFASVPANVYIRSHNAGAELTTGADKGVFIEFSNNTGFLSSGSTGTVANVTKRFYARVKVCDVGIGLEANCKAYGSNYKPEGLVQQNAERIRVGAAGYLLTNGGTHANGIVRALLRDNGPTQYNGFGARQPNPNKEWDESTGVFVANPDAAVAPVGVTKSGAINYLNQFGYANGYETKDTLGELYWSVLAYYKNTPLDAKFTESLSANPAWYDGFPAISGAQLNDPIQYSCQGNSIVTIGDAHTWCDTRVPGGKGVGGTCAVAAHEPLAPIPADGTDPGLNVIKYLEDIGKLPLDESQPGTANKSFSTAWIGNAANGATYGIAGMAYYAHTQDIRADDATKPNTLDRQTIDTFAVDVMEPDTYSGKPGYEIYVPSAAPSDRTGPNQYWMAAKYGGFDDINNDGKPASVLTWHTNDSTVANKDFHPDNYFVGNRPDLLRQGLSQIFNRVTSKKSLSAAGPNVSSARSLTAAGAAFNYTGAPGFPVYATKYMPGDWTGDVSGMVASGVAGGAIRPLNTPWSAQLQLDKLGEGTAANPNGWDKARRVLTYNRGGVAFRWNSLSSAQKTSLNNDSSLLDYLRGDRSNEGKTFRARRHLLGDIVGSESVLVQSALSPHFSDSANPGYAAFADSVKNRRPVVYVGANDGMMHAFAADFAAPTTANPVAGGGGELFAYIPSLLLSGPNGTPAIDGLASNAKLTGFTHHFFVDQTPQVADVDFSRAGSASAAASDWHTLLVGSLGKGGKGIYALDVTSVPANLDPAAANEEGNIRNKVLWEFTDADMGYSFGRPLIVKTRRFGWVVLMTSGYNNSNGHGYLYVLNPKTGAVLDKLDTGVGSASAPSGLGRATAYTQQISDGTIEQVYAGDLLGNVWRFDLSSASSSAYPAPVLFARLTDSSGKGQPITTAPRIEIDIDSTGLGMRRWVFVGTGKFLDTTDLTDTQQQSMYALRDGDERVQDNTGLPRARGALKAASAALDSTLNLADSDQGWYYDLRGLASGTNNGATERIVVDPDAAAGLQVVTWATLIPTDDPCSYRGAIYATGFDSGRSVLLAAGSATTPVTSLPTGSAVTKVQIVQLPSGEFVLLYGETGMDVGTASMLIPSGGNKVGRVNWREVFQ